MSVDLRTIRPEMKEILLNKNVIAINQDLLGIQGRRVYQVSLKTINYIKLYMIINLHIELTLIFFFFFSE